VDESGAAPGEYVVRAPGGDEDLYMFWIEPGGEVKSIEVLDLD